MCSAYGKALCILTVLGLCAAFSFLLLWSIFQQEVKFTNLRPAHDPFPTDTPENLFHVVQISDVHISKFHEPKRLSDFKKFCNETIRTIDPELVIITGDLTDAKTKNKLGSVQYHEEWKSYNSAISTINKPIIHIRGNHDAFDEPDFSSSFYQKYGGESKIARNRKFDIKKSYGTYSFVAVDAASEPGFKRPFNFVGYIKDKGLNELKEIGSQTKNSNHSIWFGHYPTSTMHRATLMRQVFAEYSTAYLCGHLHDGAGQIPKMQHVHQTGLTELELADWKVSRAFRIMSFDHDIFSITDFRWSKSKIFIHVTNPPNWQLTNPEKQPLGKIAESTHVRVLIFSQNRIKKVIANIDGEIVEMSQFETSQFWTAPWNPKSDESGNVTITAFDNSGLDESVTKIYRTRYTSFKPAKFSALGTFILSVDFCVYFGAAFWVASGVPLFFMVAMSPIFTKFTGRQALRLSWSFLLRFQILFGRLPFCTHLTYPLMAWTIWIMFLPWFFGYVVSGKLGLVSVWGIVYESQLHFAHEVYAAGFWDIVSFLWPSLLYCSYFSERKWSSKSVSPIRSAFNLIFTLLLLVVFFVRLNTVYQISSSYGAWAGFLSPVYTFPPLFTIYSSYFIFFKNTA